MCGLRRRRAGRFSARIDEVPEKLRIRLQHHARVAVAEAGLIRLHRTIEGKEIGVAGERVGEDAVARGVTLTAGLLGFRLRFRQQHGHVAIGARADFLAALRTLGAELGRLALPLRLHALIHGLTVLIGQIGTA